MTTSPPDHITRPDFAVSVRGYDRAQVDAYFGRVVEWLADAENRATAAERARESLAREVTNLRATVTMLEERAGLPAPQSMSMFSERMGQVMESALQAAQELRAEAEREARARRESSAEEVDRLLAAARDEAERVLEDARRAERAMEERIEDLHGVRAETVGILLDLQRQIAAVVGDPAQHPESPPDADQLPEGYDEADTTTVVAVVAGGSTPVDGEDGDVDGDGEGALADHGVLVTPAPTVVQPVAERRGGGGATTRGRRHTA